MNVFCIHFFCKKLQIILTPFKIIYCFRKLLYFFVFEMTKLYFIVSEYFFLSYLSILIAALSLFISGLSFFFNYVILSIIISSNVWPIFNWVRSLVFLLIELLRTFYMFCMWVPCQIYKFQIPSPILWAFYVLSFKCSWHTILYQCQVYRIATRCLYPLRCDRLAEPSERLSRCGRPGVTERVAVTVLRGPFAAQKFLIMM